MEISIVCCISILKLRTWEFFCCDSQRRLLYESICVIPSDEVAEGSVKNKTVRRWENLKKGLRFMVAMPAQARLARRSLVSF